MGLLRVNPHPTTEKVTMMMLPEGVALLANLVEAAKAAGATNVTRGRLAHLALQLLEQKPVGEIVKMLDQMKPPRK